MLVVPFLAVMLAFPAYAETNSGGSPSPAGSGDTVAATETNADPAPGSVTEDSNQEGVEEPDAATGDDAKDDSDAAAAPGAADKPKPSILVDVDKAKQEMTVFVDGVQKYTWPVSTGMSGHSTPSGTYTPGSMNEMWYSKQWDNAPMPHAIFFTKQGHAIHGSLDTKHLGSAASHGCVRLSPANATTLYTLVKETGLENVQVVLSGITKGGEGPKVASPSNRDQEAYPPWFDRGDYYQQQRPQRRRGLFGRRWFQDGAQGYNQPRYAPRGY